MAYLDLSESTVGHLVPDSDTGYCLFCGPDQLQSKLYRYPPYPKEVATLSVPTANLVLEMVVLWVGRLLQTQGGRRGRILPMTQISQLVVVSD